MRAKHKVTGAEVSVKIIDKEELEESGSAQFQFEAVALNQCRHPGIIKCLETFEYDDVIYIVTEFIPGGDL